MKQLQTIDADTLQSTVYEPIQFLISDLLPQGLHLLAGAAMALMKEPEEEVQQEEQQTMGGL